MRRNTMPFLKEFEEVETRIEKDCQISNALKFDSECLANMKSAQNDSNDKSVNTQDTCHNHWNDSFKHEPWFCHRHRTDGNTTLCSSIGCSYIREDKCESSSKPSKGSPCKWVLSNCLYFLSNHSFFRSSK